MNRGGGVVGDELDGAGDGWSERGGGRGEGWGEGEGEGEDRGERGYSKDDRCPALESGKREIPCKGDDVDGAGDPALDPAGASRTASDRPVPISSS